MAAEIYAPILRNAPKAGIKITHNLSYGPDKLQQFDLFQPEGKTGVPVVVFIHGVHHAPQYWENPETFDPERFTKTKEKLHTPFAHLPFGAGPRGCIGGNYAMLQILMILSVLLRKYDFHLVPGQTIAARPMVILRPEHGIRMTFTEAIPRSVGSLSDCSA